MRASKESYHTLGVVWRVIIHIEAGQYNVDAVHNLYAIAVIEPQRGAVAIDADVCRVL